MGRDKALLPFGSSTFLGRAIDAARRAEVRYVVGPERDAPTEVRWVREEPPFAGPVAGIAAASALVRSTSVVILAVDMPMVDEVVVASLIKGLEHDVVVARALDRFQPLPMACSMAWLRRRLDEIESDHASLRSLLESASIDEIEAPWLTDCDTPEDLATLEFFGR